MFHRYDIIQPYFNDGYNVQVQEYFSHLRICHDGQTFYYNLQRNLLEKVVWLAWSDCQVCVSSTKVYNYGYGEGMILNQLRIRPLHLDYILENRDPEHQATST